jgi:hypothetical protein
MRSIVTFAALAATFALASPAAAAVSLLTDGSGHLIGATGVVVNGTTYDVTFADGTCAGLFGGCDANSDFTFQTDTDAEAAAQALLGQVFTGGFDTDYSLTFGCATNATSEGCLALIPWVVSGGSWTAAAAYNTNNLVDPSGIGIANTPGFDTSSAPNFVWALFAPASTVVPEPSTWAMMLLGFLGIGAAVRRGRGASAAA